MCLLDRDIHFRYGFLPLVYLESTKRMMCSSLPSSDRLQTLQPCKQKNLNVFLFVREGGGNFALIVAGEGRSSRLVCRPYIWSVNFIYVAVDQARFFCV